MSKHETAAPVAEKPVKEKKVRVTMAQSWGELFHKAATDPSFDKAALQAEMLTRFPGKEETVTKWTDWYKNFYNMGKIKGYETPVKVDWKSAEDEAKIAAREQKKAAKLAEREAKKAEKAAAREEIKAQKKAEKEAAKAQAAETK